MNIEVVQLLDKVLKSRGYSLKKSNEYMWWSPFTQHHKPKLQVNIQTGKWHCWVSNQGGHNLYQLFKKVGAGYNDFKELNKLLGDVSFYKKQNDDTLDASRTRLSRRSWRTSASRAPSRTRSSRARRFARWSTSTAPWSPPWCLT